MFKVDKKNDLGDRYFPFATLEIGQSFDAPVDAEKIRTTARAFARYKKGFEVKVKSFPNLGITRCTRIS